MNINLREPIKLLTLGVLQQEKLNEMAKFLFTKEDVESMRKNNQKPTWPEIILHTKFFKIVIPKADKEKVLNLVITFIQYPEQANQHPIDYVYDLWNQLPF